MKILKAGTVLINLKNKEICLVYNKDDKSYAFPKGHLEKGETLQECAIRETEEETGHTCSLINEKEIGILKYVTPAGEDVELHLYLAKDTGIVTRKINPKDKEETLWIDIEKVEEKILYQDLKELWLNMKNNINE
jgi:8-oxo-dGTP pyrophosphatase MutT (NUDIX family)